MSASIDFPQDIADMIAVGDGNISKPVVIDEDENDWLAEVEAALAGVFLPAADEIADDYSEVANDGDDDFDWQAALEEANEDDSDEPEGALAIALKKAYSESI